jgi:hypothetical protein
MWALDNYYMHFFRIALTYREYETEILIKIIENVKQIEAFLNV